MTCQLARLFALSTAFAAASFASCAADIATSDTAPERERGDRNVALQISPLFPRIGNACNSDQANRIRAMVDLTLDYILFAQQDLDNVLLGGDTSRFDYWFGGHDPHYVAVVANAFEKMIPWLSEVEFQCGCPDAPPGTIALATHSNPSRPVHLCDPALTWDFVEFGVGAILHEFSHLAGTDDWFYCSQLGSFDWPEEFHELAAASWPIATDSAEHFRLYALDWHRGQPSSKACPLDD